MLWELPVILGE
ncbi:Protein of unknown function [Lactobacillus acidophilus DSM 9126]|nr:Protein of unknown function [Lactobacillus acidophilus DSM 20079 = JCM 1132 = NBRC 13951 = CIP 76.13]CDF68562.1 Protein of unknown function [Lactobacillus acidophilus CIRM-BIA 442]CDF72321.1 Protein of unknown function [Lactobacillus acidophilus CIRM-BIA 445]CDF74137.1 Protein of unknown function [Lactobacillus acidophilus DSM 9126]CDF76147.1 Protein of unknown function [Lactobacillus acidophilus DSM 20242]